MALILAIGTATPEREVAMDSYARNYGENLRLSEAEIQFAERICSNAGIDRKYLAIPFERYAAEAPDAMPWLNTRLGWYEEEVVGLAERAAREAIAEWGGQTEEITHILVYSTSGALSPGLDLRLMKKLGLRRGTKHFWVAFNGCHAGVMGIRTAAEIASGSQAARVLAIWVEINSCQAQSPDPASSSANNIVVASIFGDGAAAAIIVPPSPHLAHQALFEVHSSASAFIDGAASEAGIVARIRQTGLLAALSKDVPRLIEEHVDEFAHTLLKSAELTYSSVNWVVHPGGRAIVDAVEKGCHLQPSQLELSRRILNNYSNMGAPTILFVLKRLHHEHRECKRVVQWSFALAFGPGISMEGLLLRLV